MRTHIAALGLALSAWFTVPALAAEPPAPGDLDIVDVSPAFWAFWDATETLPADDRVGLFFSRVVAAYPELFTESVLGKSALTGRVDEPRARHVVELYLAELRPYIARMREISAAIRRDQAAYATDFRRAFPGYRADKPVYFTVSLFSFDGATRPVLGKVPVLFGIDGIARYHAPEDNIRVLFDHELFHDYHAQVIPETALDDVPLWLSLWEEGLATYVSGRLNPGSPEGEILLSKDLAASVRPVVPRLAREILDHFESLDKDEYAAFFLGGNRRADVPARAGYYLGYLVAQRLGERRALGDLARLAGDGLKAAVRDALESMAAPAPPPPPPASE
jgi:hypothetical protein